MQRWLLPNAPPASCAAALDEKLCICPLQALLKDFQRTTEQLMNDKLQEQRVGTLPIPLLYR